MLAEDTVILLHTQTIKYPAIINNNKNIMYNKPIFADRKVPKSTFKWKTGGSRQHIYVPLTYYKDI